MSILPMFKKCCFCKKKFTYNLSVGNLGLICPFCGMPQQKEDSSTKTSNNNK